VKVLVICFANTCRSPVAEALLRESLHHEDIDVGSRGLAGGSGELPEALEAALDARSIARVDDLGQPLDRESARSADLLLFMERRLLREAVVQDPALWPKSFTWREFARRGQLNPPERGHEDFASWLAVLHATRSRDDLLGADDRDDLSDPGLGGEQADYETMIDEIRADVGRIAPLLTGWGPSGA
jgi:protein-tyrosine phosphatase